MKELIKKESVFTYTGDEYFIPTDKKLAFFEYYLNDDKSITAVLQFSSPRELAAYISLYTHGNPMLKQLSKVYAGDIDLTEKEFTNLRMPLKIARTVVYSSEEEAYDVDFGCRMAKRKVIGALKRRVCNVMLYWGKLQENALKDLYTRVQVTRKEAEGLRATAYKSKK